MEPDLPAASIRLAVSGLLRAVKDDWRGEMQFFLRQRKRERAVMRAMEELAAASAWSTRVVPAPVTTNRHELGSAARIARGARGWARLDRF